MLAVSHRPSPALTLSAEEAPPDFATVYRECFDYVWRSARALGTHPAGLEDVVQEVFVVVHARLSSFEGRAKLRAWISRIVVNVVRHHRRTMARKSPHWRGGGASDPDMLATSAQNPYERAALSEKVRMVHRILDALDDDKREVLVLADIEEIGVPEIAEALGLNLSTTYSRLRAARQAFAEGAARMKRQEERGDR